MPRSLNYKCDHLGIVTRDRGNSSPVSRSASFGEARMQTPQILLS
ncbi:MAG TPA: hypothetical protein V6D09_09830 [Leptolyngbyaceae cyanobacterium]